MVWVDPWVVPGGPRAKAGGRGGPAADSMAVMAVVRGRMVDWSSSTGGVNLPIPIGGDVSVRGGLGLPGHGCSSTKRLGG